MEEQVKKKRGRPRKKTTDGEPQAAAKKKTTRYYDLEPIRKENADFNMIFGMKGNGKTTGVLQQLLQDYFNEGREFVVMRRWNDDIVGSRAKTFFADIVHRNMISKYSGGKWDGITFWQKAWYLTKHDRVHNKDIKAPEPFAFARSLNAYEHDNGNAYPRVYAILFDEFITDRELTDEFELFFKCYDNIKRDKENFRVYLCGNTVNYFSSYFEGFGMDVRQMEQGKIYTTEVTDHGKKVKVAAEYCANIKDQGEKSTIAVFAANNPKLRMIINGDWEIGTYHHGEKYLPKEKLFHFFIVFHEFTFKCDVVQQERGMFIKIYTYTGTIDEDAYVYTEEIDADFRHMHALGNDKISTLFKKLYSMKKVFYDSNTTGNVINSWLQTM